MKLIIVAFAVAVALFNTFPQTCLAQSVATPTAVVSAPMYSLTVVLSNVNKRTGQVFVGLVNSAANFAGESYRTNVADVSASGEISVSFDSLTAGRYAVRLFQDMNGNKKIDFNGQMPTEPFGFSNVTMLMGPPDFDQCAFDLAENKRIQVSLIEL